MNRQAAWDLRLSRDIVVFLCTSLLIGLLVISSAGVVSGASGPIEVNPDEDLDGDGTEAHPYLITNASELQSMSGNLTAYYALGSTIDASNTSQWENGFNPVGNGSDPFEGAFDGNGFEIENLTVDRGSENYVGLFGVASNGASVGNVTVTNATITGYAHIGVLVGETNGAVYDAWVEGKVTTDIGSSTSANDGDGARTGGAVGMLDVEGTVSNVTANVEVSATDESNARRMGGLVGFSYGEIRDSKATGDIAGRNGIGGLIGRNVGHIENATATGNVTGASEESQYAVGGLAGYNGRDESDPGSITRSSATGTVNAGDATNVGGLIGSNNRAVNRSYATGAVTGGTNVGGLVGRNANSVASVDESFAIGATEGGSPVGGLVGYNEDGTVSNSYATGTVTGDSSMGGLVGSVSAGSVDHSFWDVDTTGQDTSAGADDDFGLTTGDMQGLNATVELFPFDFEDVWRPGNGTDAYPDLVWDSDFADTGEAYDTLVAGDGSSVSPYEVTTVYELQRIDLTLESYFELQNDINASTTANWYGGDGFDPIGDSNAKFTGSFDGQGHTIAYLTIDRNVNVGLFGVTEGATLESVTLVDIDITGDTTVGGLVGTNDGDIRTSSATGTVNGTDRNIGGLIGDHTVGTVSESWFRGSVNGSLDLRIGGLSGSNSGLIEDSYSSGVVEGLESDASSSATDVGGLVGINLGDIERSNSSSSVIGEGNNIGGLVGNQGAGSTNASYATGSVSGDINVAGLIGYLNGGTVTQSYASGDIEATANNNAGGLVGRNNGGDIEFAYATGNVTSDGNRVGGLVGRNEGIIASTYATGNIEGVDRVGGLIGWNDGGDMSNSYWDIGTTNKSVAIGDDDGTESDLLGFGVTTDETPAPEMQGLNATVEMHLFDFEGVWQPGNGTEEYPDLAWDSEVEDLGEAFHTLVAGDGSSESPFQVTTVYELQRMDALLDAHFVLQNDIAAEQTENWHDGAGFDPIGTNSDPFAGTIDGDGHNISNLTITRTQDYVGLIGYASGSSLEVSNLRLTDVSITGDGADGAGGLAGWIRYGSVSNVSVTGTVAGGGSDGVGGVVGMLGDSQSDTLSMQGTVSGESRVGGVVGQTGYQTELAIAYAQASVEATGTGAHAGGLVGYTSNERSTFDEMYAAGDIAADNAGGVVGHIASGAIHEFTDSVYWDKSRTENAVGEDGGDEGVITDWEGLTTAQMTGSNATNNLLEFDFTTVWRTVENDYPELRWQNPPAEPEPDPPSPSPPDEAAASLSNLDIGGQGTVATITHGNATDITVDVENSGEIEGEFELALSIENSGVLTEAAETVTLNPGAGTTLTFSNITGDLPTGSFEVVVDAVDDVIQGELVVEDRITTNLTELQIAAESPPVALLAGSNETISANLSNTGSASEAFTVNLVVEDRDTNTTHIECSTTVTVHPNNTSRVQFRNLSGELTPGNYTIVIETVDDSVSGLLRIDQPATAVLSNLEIADAGTNATVTSDERVSVSAMMMNAGDRAANFTPVLTIGDNETIVQVIRGAEIFLEPTQSSRVTIETDADGITPGNYTVNVSTADDSLWGHLTVIEPAHIAVTGLDTPGTIVTGSEGDVRATVTNVGGHTTIASVSLVIEDAEGVTLASNIHPAMELAPGKSETLELAQILDTLAAGTYSILVETPDDSWSDTLIVEEERDDEEERRPVGDGVTDPTESELKEPTDPVAHPRFDVFDTVDSTIDGVGEGSARIQMVGENFTEGEHLHTILTTNTTAGLPAHVAVFNASVLRAGNFTVNVIHSFDPVDEVPRYAGDGEVVLQYISFDIQFEGEPITELMFENETIELAVSMDDLPDNATPEDVSIHYHVNPWNEAEASFLSATDTHLIFEVDARELPNFTIVSRDPALATDSVAEASTFLPAWVPRIPGDPGPAEAAAGGLTLSLGWVLRPFMRDIVGSFIIYSERTFKAGDEIEWGERQVTVLDLPGISIGNRTIDANRGIVQEVGYRSTWVRSIDDRDIIIPNAYLMDMVVTNASGNGPLRLQIKVLIDLQADITPAKESILQAAQAHESVLANPMPMVYFMEFQETTIHLRLHVWIDESAVRDRLRIEDEISATVNHTLAEEGLAFEYPTRSVADPDDILSL